METDGKKEQASYDQYACWCEETLNRKSASINKAKEDIASLETKMKELSGDIASHGAEIKQLEADIKENVQSQRDANDVREKENMDYTEEKTESEQCIGALEAAIKVLAGAGTGKTGFLATMKEAQLLSVVAGIRSVLKTPLASNSMAGKDLDMVKHFVNSPEDFVNKHALSAVQISNNPFGDYAPQSTQIQGILKGMYDAFTSDLEKANAEEADQQKAHEELMATKQMELKTLQATLERQTLQKAEKGEAMAESKRLRDDTRAQLDADRDFFADTKQACRTKATEWSERTRLRTEELQGMMTAINILSSPEAQSTFEESATTMFVQLSSAKQSRSVAAKAYTHIATMAQKAHSLELAEVATAVRTGGHFDKVIVSIDSMIETLRKEEQSDIEHRDRCEGAENKGKNDREDLASAKLKAEKKKGTLEAEETDLRTAITDLTDAINKTDEDLNAQLSLRNTENRDFKQAIKTDTEAVALLERALVALARFYKNNKISLSQKRKRDDPEYTVDPDKAPETTWSGAKYGGRKSENEGIVAIMSMIKEDIEKEMQVARAEEKASEEAYDASTAAARKVRASQVATKVATEENLAEVLAKIDDTEAFITQKSDDITAEGELKEAVTKDCSWVETHFQTRRDKRKAEIDGLVEAKNYLAGVDSGTEVEP